MTTTLIFTIVILLALGAISALVLYFVAQKFKVYEDPRIDHTETLLPGANCGGCGFAGCRGFADALVVQDDISALYCPVGGAGTMTAVAEYLGKTAPEKEPMVAVIKCNGAFCNRPHTSAYGGALSCAVQASLYGGETDCSFGCLGKGDCVTACKFDAIHVNPDTGLVEIDQEKCTACGACVTTCPKKVLELRKKGIKNRRIFVSCINKDKGGPAKRACSVACIGCGKCVKICPFDAITLADNLAYIDYEKCKLCRKCVAECPTNAIWEVNFPAKKIVAKITEPKADEPKADDIKPVETKPVETKTEENTAQLK